MISIQDGQLDLALADCNKATELDPSESWAYVVRANVWLAKQMYAQALADLNAVIRIDAPIRWDGLCVFGTGCT